MNATPNRRAEKKGQKGKRRRDRSKRIRRSGYRPMAREFRKYQKDGDQGHEMPGLLNWLTGGYLPESGPDQNVPAESDWPGSQAKEEDSPEDENP